MGKNRGFLSGKSSGKSYGGDDGCIGNRKVRTITISMLLITFCCLGLSYLFDQKDYWHDSSTIAGIEVCSRCKDAEKAYTIAISGSFTIIASGVLAILLFFVNCDDNLGRVTGAGLIVGGLLYIIGWTWTISLYNDTIQDLNQLWWDQLDDDTKNRFHAMLASWFGEALLPSATAILLGSDVFTHLFDSESHRLASNLGSLMVVSAMTGPVYYMLSEDDSVSFLNLQGSFPYNSDGYPWIATGYMTVFGFCLAYVVMYICTCCTCDCKDTACVRLLMALGLIVGGILTSIGYYIYASEFTSDYDDEPTNKTIYYVGYTIVVGGMCLVWALDIGVDDIKSR